MKTLFVWCVVACSFYSANAQQKIQHVSSQQNIQANSTFLDVPELKNNPSAIIIVETDDANKKLNPHPLGVWYNGSNWAIFNQDRTVMPAGVSFLVQWKNADDNHYYQTARGKNISNGKMLIDHFLINNNPAASFYVTQLWNLGGAGGVYNPAFITTEYNQQEGRWYVKNENNTPLPEGCSFNIILQNKSKLNPVVANLPTTFDAKTVLTAIKDLHLDFEGALLNWKITGTAFSNQPVNGNTVNTERVLTNMELSAGGIGGDYWKGMPYPIGIKGNNWIGTYENGNGDAPTGTLTSPALKAEKQYLTFLLGGGKDISKLYVELQVKKADYDAAWGTSKKTLWGETEDGFVRVNRITSFLNSEELFRYYFDLNAELNGNFQNKIIRVCIVDDKSTGWGHINADDFVFTETLNDFLTITKNGFTLFADKDKPVWGFIDAHTHPAAHLSNGGSLIQGKIDGDVKEALQFCHHGMLESMIEGVGFAGGHNNKGWPVFSFWPSFEDKTHQTLHVDWIKRAYDGGMRIIVALAVNTTTLSFSLNKGTYSDAYSTSVQLDYLNNVFSRVPWAKICTSPAQARQAILENKLAVVFGIEVDNIEDFTTSEYLYRRNHGGTISASYAYPLPLKPIDATQEGVGVGSESYAENAIKNLMVTLKQRNIVQLNPIHFADNMVGGAAVYNRFFNEISYQSTGEGYNVTDGSRYGFKYLLHKDSDDDLSRLISTGGNHLFRVAENMEANSLGHMNAKGLTTYGKYFVKEMARNGLLWDIDHSSYLASAQIIQEAVKYNYPLLSSHSDFSELYFNSSNGFTGDKRTDYANFRTSNLHHLPHESQKNPVTIQAILQTGGMFNPILTLTNLNWQSPLVANNCPGSSRTWAQKYLYITERTNGRGTGLATDRGLLENVGPRFGNKAAAGLSGEEIVDHEQTVAYRKNLLIDFNANQWKQSNGVRYATSMRTLYSDMFRNHGALYGNDDAMMFYMFASLIYEAGARSFNDITTIEKSDLLNRADGFLVKMETNPADFSGSIGLNPGKFMDRWRPGELYEILKGMFAANVSELTWNVGINPGNPWERAAAGYCIVNNLSPQQLTNYNSFNKEALSKIYNEMKIAWDMTVKMEGNNQPLRRCTTAYRDWDFNLDGIAHEGMLPDFIQDLKNIGIDALHIQPLFKSAEQYLQLWEKAEASKQMIK